MLEDEMVGWHHRLDGHALTKLEMNSGPCIKGDFPYKLNTEQALCIIFISVSLCLSFVHGSQ